MKRLASIVIVMMLALSTPAQAHENFWQIIIKFHNLIHAIEQMDKEDIEYEIERTIIYNLELWKQQKQQENNLKKVGKTG
jgi:uncharacterized protein YeeX (DUF496 family)